MKGLSRRQFLTAAAGTIGAGLVTACAPAPAPTPQVIEKEVTKVVEKVVTAAAPVVSTPKPPAPVTIRWTSDERHAYHDDQITLFRENNPHIKIEYNVIPEERGPKYLAMIAANDVPDVSEFATPDAAYTVMANNNLLAPVDTSVLTLSEWIPAGLAMLQDAKGQQLGVPLMLDGKPFMYMSVEALKAAGLEASQIPSDPDGWREALKKLTKKDAAGKITTYALRMSAAWQYGAPWIYAYVTPKAGGKGIELDYLGGGDANTFKLNTPEIVKGLKEFIRLFQEGVCDSSQDRVKGMGAGFYAGAAGGTWLRDDIRRSLPNLQVVVLPPPHLANRPPLLWAAARLEAVSTTAKNPKEAWQWVKFLTSRNELLRIYKDGAYLPATNVAWDYLVSSDEDFKTNYGPFKGSWITYPNFPTAFQRVYDEIMGPTVGDCIAGKKTVEDALAAAEKDAKAIFSGQM